MFHGRREEVVNVVMMEATAGLPISYKLGPRLDDVRTWSDFKSETRFGFLSPNYTGEMYLISFCKT